LRTKDCAKDQEYEEELASRAKQDSLLLYAYINSKQTTKKLHEFLFEKIKLFALTPSIPQPNPNGRSGLVKTMVYRLSTHNSKVEDNSY